MAGDVYLVNSLHLTKLLGLMIGGVLGLSAGYFITTIFLTSEPIPKGYVRVHVKNLSGQNIKNLTLIEEGGSIEIKPFDLPNIDKSK